MIGQRIKFLGRSVALAAALAWAFTLAAQEPAPQQDAAPADPTQPVTPSQDHVVAKAADGRRSADLPEQAYAVAP